MPKLTVECPPPRSERHDRWLGLRELQQRVVRDAAVGAGAGGAGAAVPRALRRLQAGLHRPDQAVRRRGWA